jgi:hypothetical protein
MSMRRNAVKPTDGDWEELIRDLARRVAVHDPEWTNYTESDPGITLVELFAFFAESLLDRGDLPAEARVRLHYIVTRLERASDSDCADGTPTRTRYFVGRLMSPDDFAQEQSYTRTRHRRHNRLLHGVGIVRGLEVTLEPGQAGGDPAVVVSPGLAIAPDGEEMVVCDRVTLDVCSGPAVCYVTLALSERLVDPTVEGEATRIEESAAVGVSGDVPPGHLGVARLKLDGGLWRTDPSFKPPQVT